MRCCCSVTKACPILCDPINCSTPSLCPLLSPRVCSNSCPLSQWCHLTISSSVAPFSSCPQSFSASGSFPMSWCFASAGQSVGASASALSFQWIFRVDFLWDWLVWSLCCPRGSQESFPVSQFKSINSLALCLLYGPTLTSVHVYWTNHSFDYMDLCVPSDVSAF